MWLSTNLKGSRDYESKNKTRKYSGEYRTQYLAQTFTSPGQENPMKVAKIELFLKEWHLGGCIYGCEEIKGKQFCCLGYKEENKNVKVTFM